MLKKPVEIDPKMIYGQLAVIWRIGFRGRIFMKMRFIIAVASLLLPGMSQAAEIKLLAPCFLCNEGCVSGIDPRIREGDRPQGLCGMV
jgi:hypothetical protein